MRFETQADCQQFVRFVSPLVERRDVHGLIALVQRHWSVEHLTQLLSGPCDDARKLSALVLSLIGDDTSLHELAHQLHHTDPVVCQMAEHAMWSIWLRSGNECANSHIARGTTLLEKQDVESAIKQFSLAIAADPKFAEAFNQRAMAYYLLERVEESMADCKTAVSLAPLHFGAWAGLGHCYASLGDIPAARHAYGRAKQINPHLECVDELLHELQDTDPEADSETGQSTRDDEAA